MSGLARLSQGLCGAQGDAGAGVYSIEDMYSISCISLVHDHRPSHPYNAGMEHVGFTPTRQTSLAPSATRREVYGKFSPGEGGVNSKDTIHAN